MVKYEGNTDKILQWNAQLFFADKKKCIIITNKETLYSVIVLDVLKKDIIPFDKFVTYNLMEQMAYDEILSPNSKQWVKNNFSNIELQNTDNDKRVIGSMNEFINEVKHHIYSKPNISYLDNKILSSYANTNIMSLIGFSDPKSIMAKKINIA